MSVVVTAALEVHSRHCVRCGYRVDNIPSSACPECGQEFDPEHLIETTSAHRRLSWVERWALRARLEKWLWPVVLGASAFALLASISTLGSVLLPTLGLSLVYLPVGVYYLPRRALRARAIKRHGYPAAWASEDRRVVRKCRRMILITLGLILLRVPFLVCFYPSLSTLEKAGEYEWTVRPALDERPEWKWIGLIPIRRVYVWDKCVVFETPTAHLLVYDPDQTPHFGGSGRFWRGWIEMWEADCEVIRELTNRGPNRARCG